MSRFHSEQCWILHRRPWRESSLLVELFSREHGRVGLVARGLRSQSSPWRGLGEPFAPLRSGWVRRGELGTLAELEAVGGRVALVGQALWCGLYANELLLTLIGRDEPAGELFDAYASLLPELLAEQTRGMALRRFELALLYSLGVAPDFAAEALQGEPIEADGLYRLDPEAGFIASAPGRGVYSGRAILSLAGADPVSADPMIANLSIANLSIDDSVKADLARQAREIMRALIDHQLNGRSLKTRELFRSTR